ncbi:hypothetical protein ATO3_01180 [Marinibacterium profundimaris]|uniref:PhnA-like protein n=2 Tax=Marinibacterium profundimaris TaxID=1679460 RepID=A0A225NSQ5_9RHOB|nr:hypothetical protein ATO3_01180 [Marinibacterium profundimaris]
MAAETAPARTLPGSYVDWPAIIAGAVVAAAIAFVFAGFGAALGLSTASPYPNEGWGIAGMVITGLWLVLTLIASYGAGGYVAGRMRRRMDGASGDEVKARDGLHGLIVWALGALLGAVLIGSVISGTARLAGNVASGAAQAVGTAASAAADGASAMAQGDGSLSDYLPEGLQQNPAEYINSRLLRGVPAQVPETTDAAGDPLTDETRQVIYEVIRTGEINPDDREYLVAEIADRTTLSQDEVNTRIDEAVAAAQEMRAEAQAALDEAEETAREAANTARISAVLSGFVLTAAMFVAAAAAFFGARSGGSHRDEGRLFGGFSHHS